MCNGSNLFYYFGFVVRGISENRKPLVSPNLKRLDRCLAIGKINNINTASRNPVRPGTLVRELNVR